MYVIFSITHPHIIWRVSMMILGNFHQGLKLQQDCLMKTKKQASNTK